MWSKIMRDDSMDITARLRASETLGRSQGDFIDRHEHSSDGSFQFNIVLTDPRNADS